MQVATNIATVMAEVGKNAKFYDFGGGGKQEGGGDLLTGILARIPQIFAQADAQNQALNGESVSDTIKTLVGSVASQIKGQPTAIEEPTQPIKGQNGGPKPKVFTRTNPPAPAELPRVDDGLPHPEDKPNDNE